MLGSDECVHTGKLSLFFSCFCVLLIMPEINVCVVCIDEGPRAVPICDALHILYEAHNIGQFKHLFLSCFILIMRETFLV